MQPARPTFVSVAGRAAELAPQNVAAGSPGTVGSSLRERSSMSKAPKSVCDKPWPRETVQAALDGELRLLEGEAERS